MSIHGYSNVLIAINWLAISNRNLMIYSSLAIAGLFYARSKPRIAAHDNPESFRKLSLRTAVYGGDHLGAAFLCEQAHLSKR